MKSTRLNVLKVALGAIVIAAALFILAGCTTSSNTGTASSTTASSTTSSSSADKTITVAASPTPHAEILAVAASVLAQQGYTLKVIEYTDYILPNVATTTGEVDANYFQHQPYLTNYNQKNGTNLVSVAKIHFEPLAIYAGKSSSLSSLKDGATVAVPNDATNEARALLLLADQGLITLKDPTNLTATINDIASNPKNLQFKELEAAAVPAALPDVDIAVINGNYALSAGLTAANQLAAESATSLAAQTYANILVTTPEKANTEKIQALAGALQSSAVRDFITTHYNGAVIPVF